MPRERTKPPTTAVKRVDFFLQNVMTSGERRRETPKHNPDKQPRINKKVEKIDTLFYPKLVQSYIVKDWSLFRESQIIVGRKGPVKKHEHDIR